jgi:parvulin-like peptidyl-prolyl isomerase
VKLPKILREPLVHFLLIGLGLFLLYGRVASEGADSRTIEVTGDRVDEMARQFQAVWSRPPTANEMQGLIDTYIHDEVLYREGLAMGLDADDPVIKRRVRQKIDVISEEIGNQQAPTDAELNDYLAKHPNAFRRASILSFEQVFFSGDAPADVVERQSREALARLEQGAAPASVGQATLLPSSVSAMPADLVARDFGEDFAKRLESLPLNVWHGPIASGMGAHLVRITGRKPSELPPLAAIRPQVQREWENRRRERNRAEAYQSMLKNYRVVIDPAVAAAGPKP